MVKRGSGAKEPPRKGVRRVSRPNSSLRVLILLLFIILALVVLSSRYRLPSAGKAEQPPPSGAPSEQLPILSILNPNPVSVGDDVEVQLTFNSITDLYAFWLTFRYDPELLDYQNAELGPLLPENPSADADFYPPDTSEAGTLRDIGGMRQNTDVGATGGGILLRIFLKARNPGTSALAMTDYEFADSFGYPIDAAVFSGEITIERKNCVDNDGDSYGLRCTAGDDCNDNNPNIHPGATEICGDGIDQDCSGADLPCPLNCHDNDHDTFSAGPDCTGTQDCNDNNVAIHPGAQEICGNGVDEDCSSSDLPCPPQACGDRNDNDGDGLIDYPLDPGCSSATDTSEYNAPPHPQLTACDDGLDNDGDGRVDYPADPGCILPTDNNETDVQNTDPTTPPDIGLATQQTQYLMTSPLVSLPYAVTATQLLKSCSLNLNGTTYTDSTFTRQFIVTLQAPGRYAWKISCRTMRDRTIELPVYALYYFKMDKFGGSTTAVRGVSNLTSVPDFQLEQVGLGKLLFTQPVDLALATDLDRTVTFTQNSVTVDSVTSPGINRSARITLSNIRFQQPRILRDGTPCTAPFCAIVSYQKPSLTFAVPSFTTYRVEETNASVACTFSLSRGTVEVQASRHAVLCLTVANVLQRFRVDSITGSGVVLIEEEPTTSNLLLRRGKALSFDADQDRITDFTITLINTSMETAKLSIAFAQRATTLPIEETPKPTPPANITPAPSSPPTTAAPPSPGVAVQPIAPITEEPTAVPPAAQIPYFWIGMVLILLILLILLVVYVREYHHLSPTPSTKAPREEQEPEKPELNPKLKFELQAIGIEPEEAARKIAEKEAKRRGK